MRDFEAGGLNINFFESCELEQEQRSNPSENARIIARNMLRFLMMKYEGHMSDMLSFDFLKAVFIKRNPKLLCAMRHAFQEGFDHVWEQLSSQTHNLSAKQNNQAGLFISNCLCLLPFTDLKPGNVFYIPQYIHGVWQRVCYRAEPIELTPTRGLAAFYYYIFDEARVFAYGLEPINNNNAEPLIIFMGTTYFAGQGFITQLYNDLKGFGTVGSDLYRTGHEKITTWLDKQQKKAHAFGMSLGGIQALLLANHQGDKLSCVHALNPPGLYNLRSKHELDNWDELEEKPKVFIQKQGNDFVSSLWFWKKEWTILKVTPPEDLSVIRFDHGQNFSGFQSTIYNVVDTEQDNEERFLWTAVMSCVRDIAYCLVFLPFFFLIQPLFSYMYKYMCEAALLGVVFTCMLPFMPLSMALLVIFVPVVLHVVSMLVASLDILMGFSDLPCAKIHEPDIEEENNLELG